jgi:hypothetical protein
MQHYAGTRHSNRICGQDSTVGSDGLSTGWGGAEEEDREYDEAGVEPGQRRGFFLRG